MATKTMAASARILVPTDFSTGSERAWDLAQRLGVAQSAELCLVHVLPATPIDVEARLRKEEDRAELRARAAEHQLAILRESRLERTRTTMTSEGGR
jgi:nucleotide-binding universal stress UspA family protein